MTGFQPPAMRLASAATSARPRSVSASSARPRKRSGWRPSTWPCRVSRILVMAADYRAPPGCQQRKIAPRLAGPRASRPAHVHQAREDWTVARIWSGPEARGPARLSRAPARAALRLGPPGMGLHEAVGPVARGTAAAVEALLQRLHEVDHFLLALGRLGGDQLLAL